MVEVRHARREFDDDMPAQQAVDLLERNVRTLQQRRQLLHRGVRGMRVQIPRARVDRRGWWQVPGAP